ncbi:MAG: hypothetical protein ABJB74_15125 [Gemmatimonas sp.]
MHRIDQTSAQAGANAAADQAAAQAQVQSAADQAAQLQAQIQKITEKAIEQAVKGGHTSGDARIELREQIRAAIDAARAEGMPGIMMPPPDIRFSSQGYPFVPTVPKEVPQIMGILGFTVVFCVVGLPIARAFARWLDRRGATPPAASSEIKLRLESIEQAVESVAVEVERISEGQRFTTRVLSERAHDASPEFVSAREPVSVGAPANARRT